MAMTDAERQKLRRTRARRGLVALRPFVKGDPFIAALIERGYISEEAAENPRTIDEAASAILDEWMRKRRHA